MNVMFLDYDGVVNTPMWNADGTRCSFGVPFDNKVNNFQAVQWISEFCQKFDYSIVVTSTWRMDNNYKDCLINGGLREGIKILGRTDVNRDGCRGDEIQRYLDNHPEVEKFIIVDDEDDMAHLSDHLIKCNTFVGFHQGDFYRARDLHNRINLKEVNG